MYETELEFPDGYFQELKLQIILKPQTTPVTDTGLSENLEQAGLTGNVALSFVYCLLSNDCINFD